MRASSRILRLAVGVVRGAVEPAAHAALGIDAVRAVAAELEGDDPGDAGAQGHHLQVEHQPDVLGERVGHAGRGARQVADVAGEVAGLDALDPPLHLADAVEVFVQAPAIARTEIGGQPRRRGQHPVEDAAVAAAPPPLLGRRHPAAEHVEQLIEDHPRVANHRQRRGRRGPAEGVHVVARVAVLAAAGGVDRLDAQLQRGNRRVLAEAPGVELVERRPDLDVGPGRPLRPRLGEEHRARAEVVAANLARRRGIGHPDVGVADDGERVAVRLPAA